MKDEVFIEKTQYPTITDEEMMLLDSSISFSSLHKENSAPRKCEEILIVSNSQYSEWYYMLLSNKDLKKYNAIFTGKEKVAHRSDKKKYYRCIFNTFIYSPTEHRKLIQSYKYTKKKENQENESATNKCNNADTISGGGIFLSMPKKKILKIY